MSAKTKPKPKVKAAIKAKSAKTVKKSQGKLLTRRLVTLGVGAILAIAAFMVVVNPRATCAHTITDGTIIHIDEKGFDPKNVTIEAGQKVVFENAGFSDVWPASDDHPTHENFSAFDPKKPILPGESWEFTFNGPGTFAFHDHLSPPFTGEVVVTGTKVAADTACKDDQPTNAKASSVETAFTAPAEPNVTQEALLVQLMQKCQIGDHSCIKSFLGDVIAKHGAKPSLDLYRQAVLTGYVTQEGDGHQVAHQIGRKTAQLYGVSFAAFELCDTSFNYGCQHGYFEYVIGRTASANDAMDLICGSIGANKPHKALAYCYHGAGHGVMMAEANDMDRSLVVCNTLLEGNPQTGCFQGVFMENTNAGMRGEARSGIFDTNNLLMPCTRLDQKYQHLCYESLAGWIAIHSNSVDDAAKVCVKAPDASQIQSCLLGIGLMSTSPDWQPQLLDEAYTPDLIKNANTFCKRFPTGYVLGCIEAGVSTLSNFDELDTTRMNNFCRIVDEEYQPVCYRAMHNGIFSNATSDDDITKACSNVDEAWRSTCQKGN